jgi:hypothetical protein
MLVQSFIMTLIALVIAICDSCYHNVLALLRFRGGEFLSLSSNSFMNVSLRNKMHYRTNVWEPEGWRLYAKAVERVGVD